MSVSEQQVFDDELALLESMYPDVVTFDKKASQLDFIHIKSQLSLRIPPDYPVASLPEVLSATGLQKQDLRNFVQQIIKEQHPGEPCLDAILESFLGLVDSMKVETTNPSTNADEEVQTTKKTVIIYLHHLLALSKRKLALNPSSNATAISGITKPGYPGVLVFSGSAYAVDAHVRELKDQNWQAFQVRIEDDEIWSFKHGDGIVEVETMAEVVAEVGEARKKDFLTAMKITG
ncbi:hypothetical protein BLS_003869 [Venturia inaequalis]|uniref:RWD domain-containing protein n=1 Tax=Venturia inaequalis TaxID=5025 RepID=A0A8H3YXS6_VENIN|nr:hypothetical protein EG328_007260 [Venturia inaequalis]KAE9972866.1 hypothetical protein BLS_003869 [Venturia inaequalis]KAE9987943.1 hypothetical protein EG327_003571 [Venturia inaequalis]RDI88637.1 hypothetical protein Vi05172_g1454 [Venturia inaequalis]